MSGEIQLLIFVVGVLSLLAIYLFGVFHTAEEERKVEMLRRTTKGVRADGYVYKVSGRFIYYRLTYETGFKKKYMETVDDMIDRVRRNAGRDRSAITLEVGSEFVVVLGKSTNRIYLVPGAVIPENDTATIEA